MDPQSHTHPATERGSAALFLFHRYVLVSLDSKPFESPDTLTYVPNLHILSVISPQSSQANKVASKRMLWLKSDLFLDHYFVSIITFDQIDHKKGKAYSNSSSSSSITSPKPKSFSKSTWLYSNESSLS